MIKDEQPRKLNTLLKLQTTPFSTQITFRKDVSADINWHLANEGDGCVIILDKWEDVLKHAGRQISCLVFKHLKYFTDDNIKYMLTRMRYRDVIPQVFIQIDLTNSEDVERMYSLSSWCIERVIALDAVYEKIETGEYQW